MRRSLTMLILTLATALPNLARADESVLFEASAELPAARIMCVGAADFPEMLRFAFQAEPEGRSRPDVIRTGARREARRATRPAALREAARQTAPAGPPVLHLPCIQG